MSGWPKAAAGVLGREAEGQRPRWKQRWEGCALQVGEGPRDQECRTPLEGGNGKGGDPPLAPQKELALLTP